MFVSRSMRSTRTSFMQQTPVSTLQARPPNAGPLRLFASDPSHHDYLVQHGQSELNVIMFSHFHFLSFLLTIIPPRSHDPPAYPLIRHLPFQWHPHPPAPFANPRPLSADVLAALQFTTARPHANARTGPPTNLPATSARVSGTMHTAAARTATSMKDALS